ncbi:MAG: hypothetical protein LBU44_02110, partial [Mediterranea sp.]|nr:hypothetical protein [Mediterranea sp.]
ALGLKHKFCKILIKLTRGTGASSAKDISARLSGMPKTATVDLNNFSQTKKDSITVGTDSVTIKAYTVSSADTEATIEAIVAPHSGTGKFAGRKFTFTTAGGQTKTYNLPDNVTFEAGKVYTFTIDMAGTLIFDGLTNCYIVASGAELKFPVSRAYRYYKDTGLSTILHVDGSTYTGGFSAAVVWADAGVIGSATVSGSGNSATVTVKANAAIGNAVVKIYKTGDSSQTPVWSYHIWVTSYTGAETYTNIYNANNNGKNFVFMDRNLGATKAGTGSGLGTGLFYQWGRKDPFPATDAVSAGSWSKAATSPTNGTVENTIENPGVFYIASTSPYDWLYARNNELWGHSGSKTIYDPCPSGWRVPVNSGMSSTTSPWAGFTKDNGGTWNSGWSWGANAAYPAAGYRYYDGGLSNVGITGIYWIASPSSINITYSSNLYFGRGFVNVDNSVRRSNGLPVRCTQE